MTQIVVHGCTLYQRGKLFLELINMEYLSNRETSEKNKWNMIDWQSNYITLYIIKGGENTWCACQANHVIVFLHSEVHEYTIRFRVNSKWMDNLIYSVCITEKKNKKKPPKKPTNKLEIIYIFKIDNFSYLVCRHCPTNSQWIRWRRHVHVFLLIKDRSNQSLQH